MTAIKKKKKIKNLVYSNKSMASSSIDYVGTFELYVTLVENNESCMKIV